MIYDLLTPEQKQRCQELQDDRGRCSYKLECAYDIVRAAMALFDESDLQTLKNAIHLASVFLNDELDELESEAQELGLNVWIATQTEADVQEEQERLDEEEREQEEQEDLERMHAEGVQVNSDEA